MASPSVDAHHHHRSTTKQSQKPFKARHATKSTLKEKSKGKIERVEKGSRKTLHQQIMSKLQRKNQAKQRRITHHAAHAEKTGIFFGKDAVPRIVAVIPLDRHVDTLMAIRSVGESIDAGEIINPQNGQVRLNVERFKQQLHFVVAKFELLAALDACRVADFVVFVMSAEQDMGEEQAHLIKTIESQGISNVLATVQRLDKIEPAKRRVQVSASLKSSMSHFFPTIEKVTSLDSRQETLNLVRSLCTVTPRGIRWREERGWMMVEQVKWSTGKQAQIDSDATGQVIVTGVIRGKSLKADRLVQIDNWGEFQIEQIVAAPAKSRRIIRGDVEMKEQQESILDSPTVDQDDLLDLAPEEIVMQGAPDSALSTATSSRKGVLLDEHHYFSDDEEHVTSRPKRLPRGTSEYQSAWYLDDVSYSGSDLEDVEADDDGDVSMAGGPVEPADGLEGLTGPEGTEIGASEYPQSEMMTDEALDDEELATYRASRNIEDSEEDPKFPDEIELHPQVLARERLARYRGLKSARTSSWDTSEDLSHEPPEWRRLLSISNYKVAKAKVQNELYPGSIKAGSRVHIHLRNVPASLQQTHDHSKPLCLVQLLRHEHKRVAANYSITLSSDLQKPVKSKETLFVQVGPRRFVMNPLFSQAGVTPNDVHKFERYLHPGSSGVASVTAPLTWGAVPVSYFRLDAPTQQLQLIGTGTSLPPSTSRIIAKRIILTGHPYKINKRLVTVRYMFFNKEDVEWFKSMPLWTKRGKSGFLRESLGTHGYFKAVFDGKINPMDAIGISLWKRCWPKMAQRWQPSQPLESDSAADAMQIGEEAPALV